jgi:hypothetical protein
VWQKIGSKYISYCDCWQICPVMARIFINLPVKQFAGIDMPANQRCKPGIGQLRDVKNGFNG